MTFLTTSSDDKTCPRNIENMLGGGGREIHIIPPHFTLCLDLGNNQASNESAIKSDKTISI